MRCTNSFQLTSSKGWHKPWPECRLPYCWRHPKTLDSDSRRRVEKAGSSSDCRLTPQFPNSLKTARLIPGDFPSDCNSELVWSRSEMWTEELWNFQWGTAVECQRCCCLRDRGCRPGNNTSHRNLSCHQFYCRNKRFPLDVCDRLWPKTECPDCYHALIPRCAGKGRRKSLLSGKNYFWLYWKLCFKFQRLLRLALLYKESDH